MYNLNQISRILFLFLFITQDLVWIILNDIHFKFLVTLSIKSDDALYHIYR